MPDIASPIRATDHAILRYQERVSPCSKAEAIASLTSPVIQLASRFGAMSVKLGTGQRIVLKGHTVVTVLPADYHPKRFRGD